MRTQSNRIIVDENPFSIDYLINYPVTNLLALVHKDIFALTINIENCLSLDRVCISKLNRYLCAHYSNAYFVLTKYRTSLFLGLGRQTLIDLDEYAPKITVQGRSWDDTCLQIINLEQNYRWETTHIYNSTSL